MATHTLDTSGLKCPQPILEVAIKVKQLSPGDVLEVLFDCESFPRDVRAWCKRTGRTLLFFVDEGDHFKAKIRL